MKKVYIEPESIPYAIQTAGFFALSVDKDPTNPGGNEDGDWDNSDKSKGDFFDEEDL